MTTLKETAEAFCVALNARAAELQAQHGKRPLYRNFGFELGRKYARIFWATDSGQRSALAFVDADGVVRRSDSWKQAGRVLGQSDAREIIEYVAGPV